jgi:hypothetical protein
MRVPEKIDVGHEQGTKNAVDKHAAAVQKRDMEVGYDGATVTRRNTDEPSVEGVNDGDFYCSAEDFPCSEGVYVCLYSSFRGYKTLCVAESKSDILAYYDQGYCGQCIKGFDVLLNK